MSGWIIWVALAAGLGIGELTLTTGFWLAPFALGAAFAAVLNLIGVGETLDVLGFLVVSAGLLTGLRPLVASRLLHSGPALRTGAAALVGQRAVVLDTIVNREGSGTVRIGGEVWSARAFDESAVIPSGADVEIVEIRGATVLVLE